MTDEVWVSSFFTNSELSNMLGIREKYYGEDWAPPQFEYDAPTKEFANIVRRHAQGEKLARGEMTEAMYVFDHGRWRQVGELFVAGGFYAAKGALADVLKGFDLGDGELVEFPIYEADKTTRLPGPFYMINFGARKNTFLPQASHDVKPRRTVERDGYESWKCRRGRPRDGDIAVTPAARVGPDLWFEPMLYHEVFMSGRLHDAIVQAVSLKLVNDMRFSKARVVTVDEEDGPPRKGPVADQGRGRDDVPDA